MARSRALVRLAVKALPRPPRAARAAELAGLAQHVRLLDRRGRRLGALVPGLDARALEGLLHRVAGEDPHRDGAVGLERDVADALGRLRRDVLEVRRAPPDDRA